MGITRGIEVLTLNVAHNLFSRHKNSNRLEQRFEQKFK
jgi:cell division protein ZapA (FtsZ GTPase activity inhibitor)